MKHGLSTCLAMVVALHGAVLVWASRPVDDQASVPAGPGHALQVRLMTERGAEPVILESATSPANLVPTSHEPNVAVATALVQAEVSGAVDREGYVPRRWLTVAPRAVAPVLLPFPESFNERSRYTVVLNLYIEADGRVGRVEFEGVRLPDVLERAARVTFESARFTPGQVNGRIVKSLIKIEVDFDNLGRG